MPEPIILPKTREAVGRSPIFLLVFVLVKMFVFSIYYFIIETVSRDLIQMFDRRLSPFRGGIKGGGIMLEGKSPSTLFPPPPYRAPPPRGGQSSIKLLAMSSNNVSAIYENDGHLFLV